jgi:hypothetical protein
MKKNNIYIYFFFVLALVIMSCEDDVTAIRSKQLQILGSDEAYVGDVNYFGVNDFSGKLEYSWIISGPSPSSNSGTGREAEVSFNVPGTYTITVSQGDRTGSIEVEVSSKLISLAGDTTIYTESNTIDTLGFQIFVENDFVAGEVEVSYTLGGTAIEGVDYELISENPIILDGSSEEEDYYIYVRFLNDDAIETETKYLTATITSITAEINDELILDEDDYLTAGIEIEDDLIGVSIIDTDDLKINNPSIVEVPVRLSGESTEDIHINYSIVGIGVIDVTPSGIGSVTVKAGETTAIIYLQFSNSAFLADQTVTLTLDGIGSTDEEVELSAIQKNFIIEL